MYSCTIPDITSSLLTLLYGFTSARDTHNGKAPYAMGIGKIYRAMSHDLCFAFEFSLCVYQRLDPPYRVRLSRPARRPLDLHPRSTHEALGQANRISVRAPRCHARAVHWTTAAPTAEAKFPCIQVIEADRARVALLGRALLDRPTQDHAK